MEQFAYHMYHSSLGRKHMATVLIVDDSPVNRSLLRKLLETEGYEVIAEATNGKEGYDEFVKHSPDIVTLDVSMPEMNGIEALKLMNSHNPGAKIIILSAESEREKKEEALKCGADEFVTKPYKKSDILDAIKRCLE